MSESAYEIHGRGTGERFQVTRFGAEPAAGAAPALDVPGNEIWRLLALTATLVTSAGVANRFAVLEIGDGNDVHTRIPAGAALAASLTGRYTWFTGAGSAYNANDHYVAPLPTPAPILLPGSTLDIVTANLQAADDWTRIVALIELVPARGLAGQIAHELRESLEEIGAIDRLETRLLGR